jgi:hypothetical protein
MYNVRQTPKEEKRDTRKQALLSINPIASGRWVKKMTSYPPPAWSWRCHKAAFGCRNLGLESLNLKFGDQILPFV